MSLSPISIGPVADQYFEDAFLDGLDPDSWEVRSFGTATATQTTQPYVSMMLPAGATINDSCDMRSRMAFTGSGRMRFVVTMPNAKIANLYVRMGLESAGLPNAPYNAMLIGMTSTSTTNELRYWLAAGGSAFGVQEGPTVVNRTTTTGLTYEFEIIRRRGSVTMNMRPAGTAAGAWDTFLHVDRNVPSVNTPLRLTFGIGGSGMTATAGVFELRVSEVRWLPEPSLSQPLSVTYDGDTCNNAAFSTSRVALANDGALALIRPTAFAIRSFTNVVAGNFCQAGSGNNDIVCGRQGFVFRVNGAPTAYDIRLQVTMDGTNWAEVGAVTEIAVNGSWTYFERTVVCRDYRLAIVSFTGGTSPSVSGWTGALAR